jgi:hypothetical protein
MWIRNRRANAQAQLSATADHSPIDSVCTAQEPTWAKKKEEFIRKLDLTVHSFRRAKAERALLYADPVGNGGREAMAFIIPLRGHGHDVIATSCRPGR